MPEPDLIGETLKDVKIASDQKAILLEFENFQQIGYADADCCSETWIEHIELPTELPASVLGQEELFLGEFNGEESFEDDHIQFYGYKIKTDKGDLIIDYRNASNGYYGGDIKWSADAVYGGVYGQNISNLEWENVV